MPHKKVRVVTDSESVRMKIKGMSCSDIYEHYETVNIIKSLNTIATKNIGLTLTWILNHCNIMAMRQWPSRQREAVNNTNQTVLEITKKQRSLTVRKTLEQERIIKTYGKDGK